MIYNPVAGGVSLSRGFTSTHKGWDIRCRQGSNIHLMMDAQVVLVSFDQFKNSWLQVKNADGSAGNYVHMSRIDVKVGQKLKAGTVLGLAGGQPGTWGAGNSTGSHLHYGHIINPKLENGILKGVLVDPKPLFDVAVDPVNKVLPNALTPFDFTLEFRDGHIFIKDYNSLQANPNAKYPYKVTRLNAGERTGTSFVADIEFGNPIKPINTQRLIVGADPITYQVDIAGVVKTIDLRPPVLLPEEPIILPEEPIEEIIQEEIIESEPVNENINPLGEEKDNDLVEKEPVLSKEVLEIVKKTNILQKIADLVPSNLKSRKLAAFIVGVVTLFTGIYNPEIKDISVEITVLVTGYILGQGFVDGKKVDKNKKVNNS